MGSTGSIVTAVRWWHRLRDLAPGRIAALVGVALLAAAGSGEAVTLNPGDILVTDSGAAAIIRLNPIDGKPTAVAQGGNFASPRGIAIAADGDLLVVDAQCCDGGQGGVIRVNPVDGKQTVVASGGNSPPWAVCLGALSRHAAAARLGRGERASPRLLH